MTHIVDANKMHPPIPPKSEAFYTDDSEENWLFSCPEETFDFCWGIYLKAATRYERFIIAACAEVEWRKRAERWEVLAVHYYNDFHPCVREQYFWDMHSIARRNADAWRTWGEGK